MTDALDLLASAGEETSTTDLAAITALARKQLAIESDLASLEARVKEKKAELRKVQEGELPAALKAAGMKTFQLDTGQTVSYDEDLKISVPKARKEAVIEKMREWGHGGKVTANVVIDLGKGNDNAAKALMDEATKMGVTATLAEDVASGSVKAALVKRRKEGIQDDMPFFGAFPFTKATVK